METDAGDVFSYWSIVYFWKIMNRFFSNRYYHLGVGLIAILAGVKIWMQPASNLKMQILVAVVILLVVARSIYRFWKL